MLRHMVPCNAGIDIMLKPKLVVLQHIQIILKLLLLHYSSFGLISFHLLSSSSYSYSSSSSPPPPPPSSSSLHSLFLFVFLLSLLSALSVPFIFSHSFSCILTFTLSTLSIFSYASSLMFSFSLPSSFYLSLWPIISFSSNSPSQHHFFSLSFSVFISRLFLVFYYLSFSPSPSLFLRLQIFLLRI